MRIYRLLILIFFSLNIAFANVEFPQWVLIHYERLGVNTTATLDEIEEVYHQRIQALRSYTREGNVYQLNFNNKEEESLLQAAFDGISKYHRGENPLLNIDNKFSFLCFSDRWIKQAEPTDPESYLEINWREIEPKLSAAFSSTVEQPMDFGFDMGMGMGRRVNPKLSRPGNHYIAYDEIKRQKALFAKLNPTVDQIDLFREVILLQIHAKKAFDFELVKRIFEIETQSGRELLEKSLIILMENKSTFDNKDKLFERELRKYILLAKSSKVEELLDFTREIYDSISFYRNNAIADEATPLIYQVFRDRILYLASARRNPLQEKAWQMILQNKIPIDYDQDPKFGYMYMGMLSKHVKKVSSDKDLHFFEAVGWRLSKELRSMELSNFNEVGWEKLQKVEKMHQKTELRLSLLGHTKNASLESLFSVATNDSLDFLKSTIDNFIVKSCNDTYNDLL